MRTRRDRSKLDLFIYGILLIVVFILGLLWSACSTNPKPKPPTDPAPAIYEADCKAIYAQELGREPEPEGLSNCEAITWLAWKQGNPTPQEAFRGFVRRQPEWIARQQQLQVVVLPRLVVNGQYFAREDGTAFYAIDRSDFSLFARFMEGENIEPVLQQRQDIGFNMARTFGVSQNPWPGYTANVTPARYGYPTYLGGVVAYHKLLAKHYQYSNWVAFISNGEVPTLGGQLQHWDWLNATLKDVTNVIVSAINEDSAHPTSRLESLFVLPKPVGVLASHGSNGGSANGANGLPPPMPAWDWVELHTNDTYEWVRKVGKGCTPGELGTPPVPCLTSENTRADDRFQLATQAFDAAAGSKLQNAGATFHSLAGRTSVLFQGRELELARAWVAGANSIPLSCQTLPYRHGASEVLEENWKTRDNTPTGAPNPAYDPTRPTYLRVYQKGDDPACRARLR